MLWMHFLCFSLSTWRFFLLLSMFGRYCCFYCRCGGCCCCSNFSSYFSASVRSRVGSFNFVNWKCKKDTTRIEWVSAARYIRWRTVHSIQYMALSHTTGSLMDFCFNLIPNEQTDFSTTTMSRNMVGSCRSFHTYMDVSMFLLGFTFLKIWTHQLIFSVLFYFGRTTNNPHLQRTNRISTRCTRCGKVNQKFGQKKIFKPTNNVLCLFYQIILDSDDSMVRARYLTFFAPFLLNLFVSQKVLLALTFSWLLYLSCCRIFSNNSTIP